jgi:peptide deformylase
MTICKVIIAPDVRLSTVCTEVTPNTPYIRRLAANLVDTMYAARGLGLAAPQIGETVRMFCMRHGDSALVMCNPHITLRGKAMARDEEGCLSLPGQRVEVRRHKVITVRWHDLDGTVQRVEVRGMTARCVQHEIDHLNGKLISDRRPR